MTLKPLHDRIVVRRMEEEEETAGGIIIPDTAKEEPQQGKVVAVGDGKFMDNGNRTPLTVMVAEKPQEKEPAAAMPGGGMEDTD